MDTTSDEQILAGYEGRILGAVALGTVASMGGRLILSPLLPSIISDLSISTAQAGFALSVLWGFTAILHYPGGRLSDRLSRKTILVTSLGLMAVGSVLLLFTARYLIFLFAVALFGAGAGLYSPTAFAQISDLYAKRLGQAFGVNIAAVNFGGVLAAVFATFTLSRTGWRGAYFPLIVLLLATLALMHCWNREMYVFARTRLDIRETGRRLLSNRRLGLVLLSASLFAFCWQSVLGFLPTFLQVSKVTSSTFANGAFAGVFVVSMTLNPFAGRLGDRFSYPRVAASGCLLSALGLSILLIVESDPFLAGGVVVLGIGLSAFWPVTNALIMEAFPASSRGGDFGAVRSLYIAFGSLGPTYVGFIAERFNYSVALAGLLPVFLVCFAIASWLTRTA